MPPAVAAVQVNKGETPMTTLKALETSLYWMQHVFKQTLDPVQRARVRERIKTLETQIANHEDNLSKGE